MKILLFGKNGQVGWELQRSLAPLGELIAVDRVSANLCGDLTDLQGISRTISVVKPDVIVNAAAYTAVDKAEAEPDLAHLVNTRAVEVMAMEANRLDAWLVHYSTDYVFNGSGEKPWVETDNPCPINKYGLTKYEGEKAIQRHSQKHLILRTSWVYASRGNNFIKTMIRLAQDKDKLSIVSDQVGAPTGADLIADVTALAIRMALETSKFGGLYHLAAAGEASWYEYARFFLTSAINSGMNMNVSPFKIIPIKSIDFPVLAKRPMNSRLNTNLIGETFGIRLPSWQDGVSRALYELLEKA